MYLGEGKTLDVRHSSMLGVNGLDAHGG
jgi:hypothetical protein